MHAGTLSIYVTKFDYSLEASGNLRALHQAIEAPGSLGTCGIVGAEPLSAEVSFDVNNLMIPGKGIRSILEGESVPDIFIPQLIELNAQGRFPFEKLIKFYSLDQINQAAEDSEKGTQSNPSFACQRRERGRKLHVTGHKSRFLPRSAWPE